MHAAQANTEKLGSWPDSVIRPLPTCSANSMASGMLAMATALMTTAAVALLLAGGVSAQTSTNGCSMSIVGLAPCLSYITGNSTTPSSTCCSQLSGVVTSAPQCLCLILNGGASQYGISLNQTQALALPGACNVKTPPVSACNGPATPTTPTTSTPATTGTTSGVKSTPPSTAGTGTGTSDGVTIRATFSLVSALLLAYVVAGVFGF